MEQNPLTNNKIRFVSPHSGWTKRIAYYQEQTGKVKAIGRGIYVPGNMPTEAIGNACQQQALDLVAYRYESARLFGISAHQVKNQNLSPATVNRVHIASDTTEARREREIIPDTLWAILHPEKADSPFLRQSTLHRQEIMPGEWRDIRLPSNAQILWDALNDPDAAPHPRDAAKLWTSLSIAEQDTLRTHPKAQSMGGLSIIAAWENSRTIDDTPQPLPGKQFVDVFYQEIPWGRFYDNGLSWKMEERPDAPAFPVADADIHRFLQSLFPETEGDKHQVASLFLSEPRRLMNLLIRPEGDKTSPVRNHIDAESRVARHTTRGLFVGTMVPPTASDTQDFDPHPAEPKLSGMQPKAPVFIDRQGNVNFSSERDPFTLLMKFDYDQRGSKAGLPVLEWAAQQVSRYAGIETPDTALMVDGDGSRAALLSERFDVPCGQDSRWLFAMDGAALMGLPTSDKYKANPIQLWRRMDEIARQSKGMSDDDRQKMAEQFFDRFALAWAMADGDLHAKNVSVLFTCDPSAPAPKSIKSTPWKMTLSPAYDTVCTRAIPGFGDDRMALKINGKDDGLSLSAWEKFGGQIGIKDAGNRVACLSEKVALGFAAFATVHPAQWGLDGEYAQSVSRLLDRAATVTRERARYMGVHLDALPQVSINEVMESRMEGLALDTGNQDREEPICGKSEVDDMG